MAANQRSWYQTLFIVISLLVSITQVIGDNSLSAIHEEVTNTIRDLQINGEPDDFDLSLRTLINQLQSLQVPSGSPIQLDWATSTSPALSGEKHVCFVVSSFEGLYINSGIGTAYYGLAELLARHGHNVTVLYTRDTPTIGGSFNDWVARYAEKKIALKFLPPSTTRIANPKLQSTSLQVYRHLKNSAFDVIHFADFEGLGYYTTLAKRNGLAFQNTVLVAGLHGPTRWILEANTGRSPAHQTELEVDYMERLSIENADYVWTPSAYLASWLSQQGWKFPGDLTLLPLPPGPGLARAPSARVSPKEIVYFGRLEKRKGLMLFCDALDILSKMATMLPQNLTVTFLGTSGFVDGQNSSLYVRSRAFNWPFRVQILSDMTRDASMTYLTQAGTERLPVIPSMVDNAPYTVFECLYAGIPFLASATPSIIPLLANGTAQNEHLFDTKPHNLASRLVTAFKSGVAPATPVYTIEQAEQAWLSFYGRVEAAAPAPVSTETPLVTVIITHFNRPALVVQALRSIEAQDYTNFEIILVDDGSSDEAAVQYLESIKTEFAQKSWKIVHTANKYLGAARNAAAKEAEGQYLIFLDDDNIAYPNQISTYVSVALKTNADILTAAHSVFKGTVAPTNHSERFWVPLGASLSVGLFKNCFGDANFFVSRESFFAVGGFTEEYGVGVEDHEFFAKAIFAGQQLVVIPEVLLHYRMHDEEKQMMFTTDPRKGEARRIRPYLAALGADTVEATQEDTTASRTRRSVLGVVARNALNTQQDCNQTLTSINPSSGPVTGGTTVTITGAGFTCGVTSVKIGDADCTGIQILSNTQISCTTPPGTVVYTAVDVSAQVGAEAVVMHAAFTYMPLSAPRLSLAQVSNNGLDIVCTLDTPTDQASGASCSSIFTSQTAALLGTGFTCQWSDSSTAVITLGTAATITFTDSVAIAAGTIRSQGQSGVSNQLTSVILSRPTNPVKPTAAISVPSIVSFCDNIALDATGSTGNAGRAFVVVWSLVSIDPASSTTAIDSMFTSASQSGSLTITIGNSTAVTGSTYTFTVTFTNWLGQTGSATAVVTKSADAVPTVTIQGNSVRQLPSRAVELVLVGSATASCGISLGDVTYAWSVVPAVTGLTLTSSTLTIPANTFASATTYTAVLTVTSNGLAKNSANVTIVVGISDLIVVLTGGNQQYYVGGSAIVLNAAGSSDPENLGPLSFAWSCSGYYDHTVACPVILPSGSEITVDPSSIGVGKYTFTVVVTGANSRTASASAWVEVSELDVLSISIQDIGSAPVVSSSALTLTGILGSTTVSLADVAWQWALTAGTIADPSTAYQTALTSRVLVIAPNVLVQGTTYTFTLSAVDSKVNARGTASITFSVAKSSSSSGLVCPTTTGEPETTKFTYAFGTSAVVEKYEVTYKYSDVIIEIPAADITSSNSITTALPAGSITVYGYVLSATDGSVISKSSCPAALAFGSASAATAALTSAAAASGLTSFDVARIAYSGRSASQTLSADISGLYDSLISTLPSVTPASATLPATIANTASLYAVSDPAVRTLTIAEFNSLLGVCSNLLTEQYAYITTLDISILNLDVMILNNMIIQARNINWASSVDADAARAQVSGLLVSLSALLGSRMSVGQSQNIMGDGVDISIIKVDSTAANGNGVSVGNGPVLSFSNGFLGAPASTSTSVLTFYRYSAPLYAAPTGTALASRTMVINTATDGSNENLGAVPVKIVVPSSGLVQSPTYECIMYVNNQWTSVGVTTTATSDGVTCDYPQVATAYAVSTAAAAGSNLNNTANSNKSGNNNGGLSGGGIAGIAIGGAIGLAAVAIGGIFGVRKYRNRGARPARGAAAAAAAPVVPVAAGTSALPIAQPAFTQVITDPQVSNLPVSNVSRAVPVAAAAPVVAAPVVAAPVVAGGLRRTSSAYSSSSSGSRSYAGSSSSSEEEIMEQEIKNIVGELTHALPRDSRALEVLGDKLEME